MPLNAIPAFVRMRGVLLEDGLYAHGCDVHVWMLRARRGNGWWMCDRQILGAQVGCLGYSRATGGRLCRLHGVRGR